MRGKGDRSEDAIVTAFIRAGHPGLAFATVALKVLVKPLVAGTVTITGIVVGEPGVECAVNHLLSLIR